MPSQVQHGLDNILANACNERNRKTKAWKFCSERSEDAVTWTVTRALQQHGHLDLLLPPDLRSVATGEPSVLLWGAPAGGPEPDELAEALERTSTSLGEHPSSRTEPDVVVAWRKLLMIVEAKLSSRNDVKRPDYNGWHLYTDSSVFRVPPAAVAATGLYELVRNWRFGCELAGSKGFVLVNLGRDSLNADSRTLLPVLVTSQRRQFRTRLCSDVLPAEEEWLSDFYYERVGGRRLGALG